MANGHSCPQAIIGNYAVPILEEKQVWGTNDQTRTAYLDTTDVARMTLASLRCEPPEIRITEYSGTAVLCCVNTVVL